MKVFQTFDNKMSPFLVLIHKLLIVSTMKKNKGKEFKSIEVPPTTYQQHHFKVYILNL